MSLVPPSLSPLSFVPRMRPSESPERFSAPSQSVRRSVPEFPNSLLGGGRLDFRILGPLELYVDGQSVPLGGPRQRIVLAMLLAGAGEVVPVDTLVDAVWNGDPPVTGRTQVAICVAGLRKAFRASGCPDDALVTVAPGYRLNLAYCRIDAREFTDRVERARWAAQQRRPERAVAEFRKALALWRGPALGGVRSDLVAAAADRLAEERLSAYEQYTALRLELGQHRALIGELTDLVRQQPGWEQARAYLMLAHYRCGRRAEALEVFRQGRQHSISELGLEPGPVLTAMHTAVLRDDPALLPPTAPVTVTEVVPAQLPPAEPAFAGREAELAALDEALLGDQGRYRPLRWGQLFGPPGVGKTALAVQWAHRVAPEFPDGQLYVDLRGFDLGREPLSPAVVLDDFIRALGRSLEQVPSGVEARAAFYHSLLAERRILIVLDNVRSYAQIRPLLPGTGNCRVIVTGREPVDGPATVRLRLDRLDSTTALTMLRRALADQRVEEDPVAAAELVRRCDGIPLALRAAAARLAAKPHWTIEDLVHRLEDPGQRLAELDYRGIGLLDSLDASYRCLPADAAAMFRRLSLVDAEEVGADRAALLLTVSPRQAEDLLEQLVDAQLLEVAGREPAGGQRYRLSGLYRLYAYERARRDDPAADRQAVRDRLGEKGERTWWNLSG
jgi:DNA-binding SARP family transcriptional activator/predicted nucleic acid-binding protein